MVTPLVGWGMAALPHRVLRLQGPLAWPAWLLVCLGRPCRGTRCWEHPIYPTATTQEPRTTAEDLEAPRGPEEEGDVGER